MSDSYFKRLLAVFATALALGWLGLTSCHAAAFPYVTLNKQTNRLSDNGTALTFNGTPLGGSASATPFIFSRHQNYPISNGGSSLSGNPSLGSVSSTVYSITDGYGGFPGLVVLPTNGFLLATYWAGTNHYDIGTNYFKISKDQGITWGPQQTLYAVGTNNIGASDTSLTLLSSGKLLATTWINDETGTVTSSPVIFVGTVSNDTVLWSAPVPIYTGMTSNRMQFVTSNPIELPNGQIMLPVYGKNIGDTDFRVNVVFSSDGGLTWNNAVTVASGVNKYSEANGLVLPSGRVVLFIRTDGATVGIAKVYSDDYGATWSSPVLVLTTDTYTGRPSVIRLASGGLFMVVRSLAPGLGTVYTTSWDDGDTWTTPVGYGVTGALNEYNALTLLSGGTIGALISQQLNATNSIITYQEFDEAYGLFPGGVVKATSLTATSASVSGATTLSGTVANPSTNFWAIGGRANISGNVSIGSGVITNGANPLVVEVSGRGLEIAPNLEGGGKHALISYNRSGSSYDELDLEASTVNLFGGSSPTSKLIVNATGVGIGTSGNATPGVFFDIRYADGATSTAGLNVFPRIYNTHNLANEMAVLGFYSGSGGGSQGWLYEQNGDLAIATGSSATERLRVISSSGLVNAVTGFSAASTAGITQTSTWEATGTNWTMVITGGLVTSLTHSP